MQIVKECALSYVYSNSDSRVEHPPRYFLRQQYSNEQVEANRKPCISEVVPQYEEAGAYHFVEAYVQAVHQGEGRDAHTLESAPPITVGCNVLCIFGGALILLRELNKLISAFH